SVRSHRRPSRRQGLVDKFIRPPSVRKLLLRPTASGRRYRVLSTPTTPASPFGRSHSRSSHIFPQGLPGSMANGQDMNSNLADRERAADGGWPGWAWAGRVRQVLAGLQAGCVRLGPRRRVAPTTTRRSSRPVRWGLWRTICTGWLVAGANGVRERRRWGG